MDNLYPILTFQLPVVLRRPQYHHYVINSLEHDYENDNQIESLRLIDLHPRILFFKLTYKVFFLRGHRGHMTFL